MEETENELRYSFNLPDSDQCFISKVTEGLASSPASHTPVVLAITPSIYTASLVSGAKTSGGGAKTSGGGVKKFCACNNPFPFILQATKASFVPRHLVKG